MPRRDPRSKPRVMFSAFGSNQPGGGLDPSKVVNPFAGQVMTCLLCNVVEQSSNERNTDWRAFSIGEPAEVLYACPKEFPPDGSGAPAFRDAYLRILRAIQGRRGDVATMHAQEGGR